MRYEIVEKDQIGEDTRCFRVLTKKQAEECKPWLGVDVWSSTYGLACTACSGPLKAMLSNCSHAKAVKRHLRRLQDTQ